MRPRSICIAALIAPLLLWASCGPPKSKNPLSDPSKSQPDKKLEGTWIASDSPPDTKEKIEFKTLDDHMMEVRVQDKEDPGKPMRMFVSELGGQTYMNLDEGSADPNNPAPLIFVRYHFAPDGTLVLAILESAPVEKAIAEGRLQGTLTGQGDSKDALITDTTEKVAEFVTQAPAAEAFKETADLRLKRLEAQTPPKD